jgi:MFS family permease
MILDGMISADDTSPGGLSAVTAGLALFMTSLDLTMVAASLPSISRDLAVPPWSASWVIMASLLLPCGFLAVFMALGERKGVRRLFAAGCLVFAAGSLLAGLSMRYGMLIGSRLLQGLGISMVLGTAVAMAGVKGRGAGTVFLFISLGIVLGPVLGGLISSFFSWRGIFFATVPVAVAASLLALYAMPENLPSDRREVDYPGGALILLAVLGFVLFLGQGLVRGFTSPLVVVSLVVSLLAAALFVRRERSVPHPVLSPRYFRSRTFSLANLTAVLVMMALAGALFTLPFYLEYARGLSPTAAGLALTLPAAAMLIAGLLSRNLSVRTGPRGPSAVSAVVLCLGFLVLARAGLTGGEPLIYGGLALIGLGAGSFIVANTVQVLSFAPPGDPGPVLSLTLTIRIIGLVLGVAVFSAVVLAVLSSGPGGMPVPIPSSLLLDAFRVAFLTGALVALLAFVSVTATRKGRRGTGPGGS